MALFPLRKAVTIDLCSAGGLSPAHSEYRAPQFLGVTGQLTHSCMMPAVMFRFSHCEAH